ncbi:MAG TPA: T9SS type A sorting domain-containing protein [Bacteroidia bacterium]|jgi:hypothetical protein|nr:T9SS type A sorting domain-containing protein [Bacteroidia bacterium]
MKKLFTYFSAAFLMFLSIAVNGQNDESNNKGFTTDKITLVYNTSPEPKLCDNGSCPYTPPVETKKLEALYDASANQLIVKGTAKNGEVEVWDITGNTIAEKISGEEKTVFNLNNLPRGVYYINYSNEKISEGAKLVVH